MHPVIAATLAHNIERAIYDVSRTLLYPVLVAALFCLGWAIVEVGWFLYELYLRLRYRDLEALEIRTLKARDAFAKGQPRRAYKYLQESNYSTVVARFLFDLIRNYQTERLAEKPLKLLQEYEFYTVKRLEKTRILVRIGPMLGLMGTLIPLAPALAGLAAGNTAVLAANLEIAFSVTVIGLLIGGLGFIVSIVRDRFYQQDISDLEYMLELLEGGGGRLRIGPPRRQRADFDDAIDDLPDLTVAPLVGAETNNGAGGARPRQRSRPSRRPRQPSAWRRPARCGRLTGARAAGRTRRADRDHLMAPADVRRQPRTTDDRTRDRRRSGVEPARTTVSTTVETPPHSGAPPDREPGSGQRLRYMGRRRINRTDRNGDPLDGVVNLFDVAIILAVGFLLAALTGIGLSGILSSKNVTIVTNPGQPDMQVITKKGTQITKLNLKGGQQVSGVGTLIGQFYRLPDGTTVYVPSSSSSAGQSVEAHRARPRRASRSRPRRPAS